ncbi:MAG: energy transducer TonB [Ferruginibacter sp.]
MNYNDFFSVRTLSVALISIGLATTGCDNNDTSAPASSSDTSTVSTNVTEMAHDSGMGMAAKPDSMPARTGMGTAKPNPAKKGMKGRVMIMPSPKMSGAMDADNSGVYSNVEVYPSFPGGTAGLQDYFEKNLTYPEDASRDGVDGTVNVMFTVDETGRLTDPHIMGEALGYGLEDEALRVVKTMPAWNPGKLKGRNVKTRFTLPVSFQLN